MKTKATISLIIALSVVFMLLSGCGGISTSISPPTDTNTINNGESTSSFTATSFVGLSEEELSPYFNLVTGTVEEFSRLLTDTEGYSVQNDTVVSSQEALQTLDNLPLSKDLRHFLAQKLVYESTTTAVKGVYKINISTDCSITEWKVSENELVCTVTTTTNHKYSDASSASLSVRGFQVVLENPQAPVFTDIYDTNPLHGFDYAVRGGGLTLENKEHRLSEQDKTELNNKINAALQAIYQTAKQS